MIINNCKIFLVMWPVTTEVPLGIVAYVLFSFYSLYLTTTDKIFMYPWIFLG